MQPAALPPGCRMWTGADGEPLFAAELVDLLDGNVCLQKPSGQGAVVPLDRLCEADRQYVLGKMARPAAGDGSAPEQADSANGAQRPGAASAAQAGDIEQTDILEETTDGLVAAVVPPPARHEYSAGGERKVVIPFDFVSQFDQGRYGQMVGELIWKKLEREGGVIIPESMLDVRDLCAANGWKPSPDTPLDEVAEMVRRGFGAHVGIWGSVERAPGADWDIYDLVIKCVDFSGPQPAVIYQVSTRTNTVSEIPHLYVAQMLDKLYGRQPGEPPPPDPIAEENWQKNPSLVQGGDFERGSGGVPLGWESRGGQHREPLGGLVSWIAEAGNPSNKVIRFQFDAGVGDGYGVMYYSLPFPVEQGARYRFQCRYRTNGPEVKVFIKCYDEMPSQYTPTAARPTTGRLADRYLPDVTQLRECYRSQQNLKGPKNVWNTHTEDFTPRHTKYTPKWGRVMLYAYLGAGVVEFDDVVLKQILPASPGEAKKELRHSMESTVTIKEMEENERRGHQAAARLRGDLPPEPQQKQDH